MIYHDFFQMTDAILAHVAATGDSIMPCDSPRCLLIGFCSDKMPPDEAPPDGPDDPMLAEYRRFHENPYVFAVRLVSCKTRAGVEGLTDSEHEAWSNYMRTTEGRRLMAEAFSRGERLWSHSDTIPAPPPV